MNLNQSLIPQIFLEIGENFLIFFSSIVCRCRETKSKIYMLNTLRKENEIIKKAREKAYYSTLNWKSDLKFRLQKATAPLLECANQEQYFKIFDDEENIPPHYQISAYTNRLYPPAPGEAGTCIASDEVPASLVYSMHVNGSIAVLIYPHDSKWSKMGRDSGYTIAAYRSANELAGNVGDAEIEKHLDFFIKVAAASVASRPPSRRTEKLLRLLEEKNSFYSKIYSSTKEHKKTMLNAELGLAAGLIGGLIASTILPLSQTFGKEKFIEAEKHKLNCTQSYPSDPNSRATCLNQRNHELDSTIGYYLSTGVVLSTAIIIAFLLTFLMRNRLRSR